jgi:nitric oxide reductase large subunit
MSVFHRTAAISAAALSGIALAYTILWLVSRDWHWSDGAAVVTTCFAAPALFLVCLSFREPSTRRRVNLALTILAITGALYVLFPRGVD